MELKRGDVVLVALDSVKGFEQGKTRPCVIISHQDMVTVAKAILVCPITSRVYEKQYGFHVGFHAEECALQYDGTIKVEQTRCVDKVRIVKILGHASPRIMNRIKVALLRATDFW